MTTETALLGALIYSIGPAILAGWLAGERGRSVGAWLVVGLLLGPLAVVAVGLAPAPVATEVRTPAAARFTPAMQSPRPQAPPEDSWRA